MIVTFPQFGPVAVALAKFFDALDVPYIMPAANNSEILKTGAEVSPEEMCTPFKYMVGNFKTAYADGADTAVMAATCGPCRLGEYGQLLMEVMSVAGCDYRWVLLDSPAVIGVKEFVKRFRVLLNGRRTGIAKILKNVFLSALLICKIDALREKAESKAGFLCEPHAAVRILHEAESGLKEAPDFQSGFAVIRKARKKLCRLEKRSGANPVRIFVTGEIYTCVEREANGNLEEKLMKAGCSVSKHISVSWWIRHALLCGLIPDFVRRRLDGGKGIPCNIGGYGRESVSGVLRAAKFDGIIKIMPSGCMPEIVAKASCEKLQKEAGYRILHLIYDEMSGQAGYDTRIEAFVDMLERRRDVLAGNRHRLHKHRFGYNR